MFLPLLIEVTFSLALFFGQSAATVAPCERPPVYRPGSFRVERYELTFEPQLVRFFGEANIFIKLLDGETQNKKPTEQRTVESETNVDESKLEEADSNDLMLDIGDSLEITSVRLTSLKENNEPAELGEVCLDKERRKLVLSLRKEQVGESFVLQVNFWGPTSEDGNGPVDSSENDDGRLAASTTRFFPDKAAAAFPCVSEPNSRATFELSLIHSNLMQSISSTPIASESALGRTLKKVVKFQPTFRMPSYAFAFAISSKFETISCQPETGLAKPLVTAYVAAGLQAEGAQFILSTICRSIPLFEDYFQHEFPLKALSITTAATDKEPSDERLASTTVGLLIFEQKDLLLEEEPEGLPSDKEALAARLAVESVARHWFGAGLVTAADWRHHWLLEALVRWRSHAVVSELHPQLDFQLAALLHDQTRALDSMARSNFRPQVSTKQATKLDRSTWLAQSESVEKFSRLLSMLEQEFGPQVLRDSIGALLQENKWASASLAQLLAHFERFIGSNVMSRVVNSYLQTEGVPLITLIPDGKSSVNLTQKTVLMGRNGEETEPLVIPVRLLVSNGDKRVESIQTILSKKSTIVALPTWFKYDDPSHWIKLNPGFQRLYRSNYDPELFRKFGGAIASKRMSAEDQIGLLDDSKALAEMGLIQTNDLKLLAEWFGENARQLESVVLCGLYSFLLPPLLERSVPIQRVVQQLFQHVYDDQRLKVPDGQPTSLVQLNGRRDALSSLIEHGELSSVQEECVYLFHATGEGTGEELPNFLLKPTFASVIKRGSFDDTFEDLVERLRAIGDLRERQQLVNYLAGLLDDDEEGNTGRNRLLEAVEQ